MKITKRQLRKIIREAGREERLDQARRGEIPWSEVDAEKVAQDIQRHQTEAPVPQEELDAAVLEIFYADGQVTTADVFDRLRMDGYTDTDIDAALG